MEYKALKSIKLDKKVDLNSPVEILGYNIEKCNDGNTYININMRNLSKGIVSAIKFDVVGYNSFNEIIEIDGRNKFQVLIQDLNISMRNIFMNEIRNVDIHVITVVQKRVIYSLKSQGKKYLILLSNVKKRLKKKKSKMNSYKLKIKEKEL